jgi:hypothetical protein
VKEWRRSGLGWFEERVVKKPYYPTEIMSDDKSNPLYLKASSGNPLLDRNRQPISQLAYVRDEKGDRVKSFKSFGPYYYFRWRDTAEGKLKTMYFGKARPAKLDHFSSQNKISLIVS